MTPTGTTIQCNHAWYAQVCVVPSQTLPHTLLKTLLVCKCVLVSRLAEGNLLATLPS